MSGRVGYDIPRQTLENIVIERGLTDVTDFAELTERDKDLVLADIMFYLYTSPTKSASVSRSHGDFTISKGGQELTDKRNIYALMMSLYRKWGDPMVDYVESVDEGGCQWMD